MQVISEYEARQSFEEMMDECNPAVMVGNLSFSPSEVLRELDPVAYRESFGYYCDNMAEDGVFLVEGYTDHLQEEEVEE